MTKILPVLLMSMLALPFTAMPSHAQDGNGLNLPPAGQTIINFSATERRAVPQDLIVSSLRIDVEDADPIAVQKKINEGMKKAIALAKTETTVKTSTGGYTVHRYDQEISRDDKTGEVKTKPVWRGSQTIDMESKDTAKVLDLTGKIQEMGFAMNNLGYTLAPETVEKVRDELMVIALEKLQGKAAIVGKALGKANYELVDVNVDTGGPVMPMYKNMMARAEMAYASDAGMPAPVAEAGETDVSITVSARALIKQ